MKGRFEVIQAERSDMVLRYSRVRRGDAVVEERLGFGKEGEGDVTSLVGGRWFEGTGAGGVKTSGGWSRILQSRASWNLNNR